jgi:polyisoprenoid-binding protein YceI
MKHFAIAVLALLVAGSALAADTFVIDRNHSEATFQVRHLVSRVSGKFDDFAGSIAIDRANPAASSVEFTIKAPSINTGNADRDKHLRSADFFDVEKFPEITFKSTSIKAGAKKDTYDVTGNFTMHGVTKQITLPVEFLGFMKGPRGREVAGFTARATLNRKDYGVVWNRTLDAGSTLLSDDVDITVNIEAGAAPPPQPAAAPAAPSPSK